MQLNNNMYHSMEIRPLAMPPIQEAQPAADTGKLAQSLSKLAAGVVALGLGAACASLGALLHEQVRKLKRDPGFVPSEELKQEILDAVKEAGVLFSAAVKSNEGAVGTNGVLADLRDYLREVGDALRDCGAYPTERVYFFDTPDGQGNLPAYDPAKIKVYDYKRAFGDGQVGVDYPAINKTGSHDAYYVGTGKDLGLPATDSAAGYKTLLQSRNLTTDDCVLRRTRYARDNAPLGQMGQHMKSLSRNLTDSQAALARGEQKAIAWRSGQSGRNDVAIGFGAVGGALLLLGVMMAWIARQFRPLIPSRQAPQFVAPGESPMRPILPLPSGAVQPRNSRLDH